MPKSRYDLVREIEQRNVVRREAHLPLLDLRREAERLAAVERQAAFDAAFEKYCGPIRRKWPSTDSWMTRLGRGALARKEFQKTYQFAAKGEE